MEKFIPVVVIKELSETDKILTALKNNDIHCAEITFRTACAAEAIEYAVKHYPDMEIVYTDTVIEGMVYPYMRKRVLKNMLSKLATARIVVTDRLHGMVLAAMANSPSLVFSNCNYKVQGIYHWISNNRFVSYCDDASQIEEKVRGLSQEENCVYNHDDAKKAFAPLTELVRK